MIEISIAQILMVAGAILTPLLTVIGVLWKDRVKQEDKEDTIRATERTAYDAMRDRMQDKIDEANRKANDAVATAVSTINSMKDVILSVNQTQKEQVAQWPVFKEDLIRSVKSVVQARAKI